LLVASTSLFYQQSNIRFKTRHENNVQSHVLIYMGYDILSFVSHQYTDGYCCSSPHFGTTWRCKWGWKQLIIRTVICVVVMDTPISVVHWSPSLAYSLVGWMWSLFYHIIFLLVCFVRVFFRCLDLLSNIQSHLCQTLSSEIHPVMSFWCKQKYRTPKPCMLKRFK
jgi:hypothetical protein